MNILFLHSSRFADTPWRDGSTRYRCYHFAEALQSLGHLAEVAPLHALDLALLPRFNVVCVLRPQPGKKLDRLLERCQRLGIRTVADVDDLIFAPELADISPSVINAQASARIVRQQFQRTFSVMQTFNDITVTTEPLAQAWKDTGSCIPVSVIPNGLSANWLNHPVGVHAQPASNHKLMTYLPGTRSHDHDFAQLNEVLIRTLLEHPKARLMIVGELRIDDERLPRDRIIQRPWIAYEHLPTVIAASHVTLAPLAPTPFTYAKSHIKFTESAAFGTPVICSPNHDICRHKVAGLHVASNEHDWEQALHEVLIEPGPTVELKQQAKPAAHSALTRYARQHCSATTGAQKMLQCWNFNYHEPIATHAA